MKETFLILSNVRCGASWLQSMLSQLPDVNTDFELKISSKNEALKPHQKALPMDPKKLDELLESIAGSAPVGGSKVILNPRRHNLMEEFEFKKAIAHTKAKVIGLFRDYTSSTYAWFLGNTNFLNSPMPPMKDTAVNRHLQEENKKQAAYYERLEYLKNIPHYYPKEDLIDTLESFKANDTMIMEAMQMNPMSYTLDYQNMKDAFGYIAHFVGSKANEEQIEAIVSNPPTMELPILPINDAFENADFFKKLCKSYERKAQSIFSPSNPQGA